jgi:uncharacterized membrane protein
MKEKREYYSMNKEELTNLIIKELSRHKDRKEIVQKVCEQSTLNWGEAERLIEELASQNKRKIAASQSPLLIFLSIGTLVLGIGLLTYNVKFVMEFFQKDMMGQILSLQSGYYRVATLVTGLGMTIGGFYGMWNTLAALFPD